MRLYAVGDLHLGLERNRQLLVAVRSRPDDWLILAGDTGETAAHLRLALDHLVPRFRQVVWVPGNHDLWSTSQAPGAPHGLAKYEGLVALCRSYGVLTPEDEYAVADLGGRRLRIAPLFLLYDYSFRPPEVPLAEAVAWAREAGIDCADEALLSPAPFRSRIAWCHARHAVTLARLEAAPAMPTVLVNHFPLHPALAVLQRIPRFSIWCGTTLTADWHLRFGTEVVVYGHLHIRRSTWLDGVRCEEVSLGYPRQWEGRIGPDDVLREIRVDGPAAAACCFG